MTGKFPQPDRVLINPSTSQPSQLFNYLYRMYQKDYILRMIEMLGDMLAAIFGLVRKGEYQKAGGKS